MARNGTSKDTKQGRPPPRAPSTPPERAPETEEGERSSPSEGGGARSGGGSGSVPDPELSEKARRRTYPASYKRQVLEEVDRCKAPGEIGALLRREGLYSSLLTTWRRQRERGSLEGPGVKRGRKPTPRDELLAELKRVRREKAQLERNLKRAELILDIQKKASEMLGIPLNTPQLDELDEEV